MSNKLIKEEDLQELRAKNKELMAKASVYTNLAYALVEVADSLMIDVNSMLNMVDAEFNKNEKRKFRITLTAGKQFKIWLKDLAKLNYKIDNSDEALESSDALYDLLCLIVDRCGGSMNILSQIRAMIFNSFKSKYNYYDK